MNHRLPPVFARTCECGTRPRNPSQARRHSSPESGSEALWAGLDRTTADPVAPRGREGRVCCRPDLDRTSDAARAARLHHPPPGASSGRRRAPRWLGRLGDQAELVFAPGLRLQFEPQQFVPNPREVTLEPYSQHFAVDGTRTQREPARLAGNHGDQPRHPGRPRRSRRRPRDALVRSTRRQDLPENEPASGPRPRTAGPPRP